MTEAFHYPPELFELLIETIARLSRSKKGVVLFLRGSGVAGEDLNEVDGIVNRTPNSINKFEIVRNVLTKVNARGDSGLRPRREIIKRVVEFEHFETCWPEDQLKAKGLVASVREAVNTKDAFTRMKQERDAEREQTLLRQQTVHAAAAEKRAKIGDVTVRLSALFSMDDKPHERGKLLEGYEVKDSATLEVLDKAVEPERNVRPRRSSIVLASALFGLLIAIFWVLFLDVLQLGKSPEEAEKLQKLKRYLGFR